MAVELAARAPAERRAGAMTLPATDHACRTPSTLNFEGGADDIPTYSLADLRACAEKGDKDFFRRHFDGKVVLIGTVLDVEDRKITSKRFATAPEGARAARCALPAPAAGQKFTRDSIAGVYVHATAVNNLIRGDALIEFGRGRHRRWSRSRWRRWRPRPRWRSARRRRRSRMLGLAAAWTAGATVAFREALALPLIEPLLAGARRARHHDRLPLRRRRPEQAAAAPELRALSRAGGDREDDGVEQAAGARRRDAQRHGVFLRHRRTSPSFAEKIAPAELVAAMNEYLSAMTDIIEAHGGFVDKYIGDAIVAVFGAPLDDPDHAANAVRAALQCAARLPELDRVAAAFGGRRLRQRIGLNTGEALVGNIGSRRRFNYTVMGDMVNLASRLEGANKFFGTTIMASETTVALTGDAFAWRELDAIRVKGRAQAVKIYEPLGLAGEVAAGAGGARQGLCRGPRALPRPRLRRRRGAFRAFAADDPPAALFLERAQEFAAQPARRRTGSRSTRWTKSSARYPPWMARRPSQIGTASAIFCP